MPIQKRPVRSALNYSMILRLFFAFILILWFGFFSYTKSTSQTNRKYEEQQNLYKKLELKLRGSAPDNTDGEVRLSHLSRHINTGNNGEISHLVIVAGHAVLRLNKLAVADTQDAAWYLLNYQLNQGFPSIIVSHIHRGIELTTNDQEALLIFSGGQTRRDVGPTSEAASYYYVANDKEMLNSIRSRTYLEEYARDSYENLLFSICRFKEVTGRYPSRITVVGFDFKRQRFIELHRKAIGFPIGNFTYSGVRPTHPNFDHKKSEDGEKNALKSFESDIYACADPTLANKKQIRNPFNRTVPYELACPEMKSLLHWCGPELFNFEGLPWY